MSTPDESSKDETRRVIVEVGTICCLNVKDSIFLPCLATGIHFNTLTWSTKTYCEVMTTTSLHCKLLSTFSIDFSCKFDTNDIAKAL